MSFIVPPTRVCHGLSGFPTSHLGEEKRRDIYFTCCVHDVFINGFTRLN